MLRKSQSSTNLINADVKVNANNNGTPLGGRQVAVSPARMGLGLDQVASTPAHAALYNKIVKTRQRIQGKVQELKVDAAKTATRDHKKGDDAVKFSYSPRDLAASRDLAALAAGAAGAAAGAAAAVSASASTPASTTLVLSAVVASAAVGSPVFTAVNPPASPMDIPVVTVEQNAELIQAVARTISPTRA
jgi:hypothetical protein